MTYQITAIYDHPKDPAVFEAHYNNTHLALVRQLPDLQAFTVTRPAPGADGQAAPYYLIAVLDYADKNAADASLASPVGQETVADLANFAQSGATLLSGPSESVL